MHRMRPIIEAELKSLGIITDEKTLEKLLDLIVQKMDWAFEQGIYEQMRYE